jgi:membrane protein involved in colicin uptake
VAKRIAAAEEEAEKTGRCEDGKAEGGNVKKDKTDKKDKLEKDKADKTDKKDKKAKKDKGSKEHAGNKHDEAKPKKGKIQKADHIEYKPANQAAIDTFFGSASGSSSSKGPSASSASGSVSSKGQQIEPALNVD